MMGFPGRLSNFGQGEMYSVQSSRGPTPRPSNFEENCAPAMSSTKFGLYPAPNPDISSTVSKSVKSQNSQPQNMGQNNASHDVKELHMFVWSSSASAVSEVAGLPVFGGNDASVNEQSGRSDHSAKEIRMLVADHPQNGEIKGKKLQ